MPPDTPRGKGPCSPFSGHSHLLQLQWLLVTKVIETPVLKNTHLEVQCYIVIYMSVKTPLNLAQSWDRLTLIYNTAKFIFMVSPCW